MDVVGNATDGLVYPSFNDTATTWSTDSPSFAPSFSAEVEQGEVTDAEVYLSVPMSAAITSKVTASLSLLGSYIVLREIFKDYKLTDVSNSVINNLLISLSVADVLSSVCTILGTLMSPAYLGNYIWGAKGNVVTCEIQGFFVVLGYMASPLFNCALAATYMMLVRYQKRDQHLQPYQPFVHASIWLFALLLAVIPLPLDWYNNGGDICWPAASPFDCFHNQDVPCYRGSPAASFYGIALYTLIPFFSLMFCGIVMCLIWSAVRNMENRASIYTSGWSTDGDDDSTECDEDRPTQQRESAQVDRTKSTEMMHQGLFFILAFFITYFPAAISWVFEGTQAFALLLFISYSILLPLQGFWNCLVFIRQRQMKTWEGRIFRYSFFLWREDSSEGRRRSPTPARH